MKASYQAGMKLSQLRVLVAVATSLNFGRAALQLQMSQSSVSHAIAALEEELGVILVLRGRHGATLTPVGERIVSYARQMLQLSEAIEKEAFLAKGLQGGKVRVATYRSMATHVLPRVIAEFRDRFPAITVSLVEYKTELELEQALREGYADLALAHIPAPADLESWELFRDEFVALLPSPPSSQPLTWERLVQYPMILPPNDDTCSLLVRQHVAHHYQPLTVAYEVMEDSTIISMVNQGLGAAILPRLAAEPIPPSIQVASLPVPLERINGVLLRVDTLHPPAVFAFLDILKHSVQHL